MHYLGLRHKHERTPEHARHSTRELSPKKNRYIKALDDITFFAGVIGPFTVLPQIYKIFTSHASVGVSAISWILMFIVTLPWIFYGIAHKDRPIIISFVLWEVANLLVIIGALLYR